MILKRNEIKSLNQKKKLVKWKKDKQLKYRITEYLYKMDNKQSQISKYTLTDELTKRKELKITV